MSSTFVATVENQLSNTAFHCAMMSPILMFRITRVHFQRVFWTFQHTHLAKIFFPIRAWTFRLKNVSGEHTLDNQTHARHATHAVGTLSWTRDHVETVLSLCWEDGCESKLLVTRSLSTAMNLKRLANKRRSVMTLFLHFPSQFECLVLLFCFDDGCWLQRICMFVLDQVGDLASFWT